MLKVNLLEKGLGIVSTPHFVHGFQEKCFSCCILLNDQISLSDCLYFLGNMRIAFVCFPGCYVINFEINLVFLIKRFFYITKKSRQKFKYFEK